MAAHHNSIINVVYWNANGIQDKIFELYEFLTDNHIHVACLNETFLKPFLKLPSHPEFITHRLDRTDRPKGGVAIIIRRNIKHRILQNLQTSLCECIGVEIPLQNGSKIHISSVYMPGGTRVTPINTNFAEDIRKLTLNNTSYFVCGDLNSRHRQWNCFRANKAGNILYDEYCKSNFLIKHPSTFTRIPNDSRSNPSTIDLVLTNGLHDMSEPVCNPTSSDHNAITFKIQINGNVERISERASLDYQNADWDAYRLIIHRHLPNTPLNIENVTNIDTIESQVDKFIRLIEHARDRAVPQTIHNFYKLCIPEDLKQSIKIKNSFRRLWQRSRNRLIKCIVNQMEKDIKKSINIIRNNNWGYKLSEIKPSNQAVWKTSKMIKNNKNIIPPLKSDDIIHVSPQEKSNVIGKEFSNNHQNPFANTNIEFNNEVEETVTNFLNTNLPASCDDYPDEDEIREICKRLKNTKAPGIDSINNRLLKKLPSRGIAFLLHLVCSCLKLSYFPSRWKHAKVIPIHKPNKDTSNPSSYRPISLLCSLSKILERVILNRVNKFVEFNNIIPREQYGFRRKFSSTHQLTRVIKQAKEGLSHGSSTGIIMLDVEKAFDRVWHNGLLFKMINLNFPAYIINMISSFLKDRSFHVDISGAKSPTHNIPFGVPQGAVLSPTLYNIFTHDIPKFIDTNLALFADDTAFYCSSPLVAVITEALKSHASLISDYMKKWKVSINAQKTQAIFITRRVKKELPGRKIKIFGTSVAWQNNSKYLGMVFEKRLTFKQHIDYVISRANIAMKVLYPLISRKSKLLVINKLLIYKVAIRPILTYACPAFINIANSHLKKLQVLQNKALKMILNKNRFERTQQIHEEAKVPLVKDYINKLTNKFNESL